MTITITRDAGLEDGALRASGAITYEDVETYMDGTRYLELTSSRRTMQSDTPFARGSYWMEPVRPSVHLTGCDLVYLSDDHVSGYYRPSLFVGMLSEGEHSGIIGRRPISASRVGVPTLLGVGSEVEIRSAQRRGQICRMNGFHVGADFLEQLMNEDVPGSRGLANMLRDGVVMREVEDNIALKVLLAQLADNPFTGTMAQIFAESRILSALVELRGLVTEYADAGLPRLLRNHRDHAEHARLVLDARLAAPPSVGELAREIGLNETDLRRSFKQAFGLTIIDYLRDRRLEVARALVRERRLPIAAIAYRVGFASPANFATAYRRRFGRAPTRDF